MTDNYKEKLSSLGMLVQVATADGKLKDVELEFFIRIAKKLEISESDYQKVFDGEVDFVPPDKEYKRVVLFHNLLLLIYSDKVVDEKEIQVCHDLGLKMGLNTGAISDILNKLKEQPQVAIDPFRVDRVFKRYYN